MIKIAICDDEEYARKKLSSIIKDYFANIDKKILIKEYNSGKNFLKMEIRFDIIFLDIEMPELNGIETAKILRKWDVNSKIIYVTHHKNYKANAYQVHAFDYITKPISEESLFKVLTEIMRYMDNKHNLPKLVFKTDQGVITMEADDVYYLEYFERKVVIASSKGEHISAHYTMKQLFEKLSKYNFEAPHKSYIVNMVHIKLIKGFNIELENGVTIPLAQKRAVIFKKRFNNFLQSTFDII